MDYRRMLQIAEERLDPKFMNVIADLRECISAGATGSEIIRRAGKYLKDLQCQNKEAYLMLENEMGMFLRDREKHGLLIF